MALAARPDLMLLRRHIADTGRYYDAERTIVLRAGMLIEDERRYLWHELEHADRRDRFGHCDAKVERLVDRHAAESAMPWSSLVWAWDTAGDLEEMASLLKLPRAWVLSRLQNLHPARAAALRSRVDASSLPA